MFSDGVDESKWYEIHFLEIGTDKNHAHFLVQPVTKYCPTAMITMIKSMIGKEIFKKHPEVKRKLWGGKFWSDGYFVNMVSKFGNEQSKSKYVKSQGLEQEY